MLVVTQAKIALHVMDLQSDGEKKSRPEGCEAMRERAREFERKTLLKRMLHAPTGNGSCVMMAAWHTQHTHMSAARMAEGARNKARRAIVVRRAATFLCGVQTGAVVLEACVACVCVVFFAFASVRVFVSRWSKARCRIMKENTMKGEERGGEKVRRALT